MGSKQKKGKSLFNRIIAWLHLWPSLISGVFLVFICLTGTIIVYCDEIMDWTAGSAKYVTVPENARRITDVEIQKIVEEQTDGYKVSDYVFYKDPSRSFRVRAFNPKERKLSMVYINPYNGEVLKIDNTIFFFFVTAHLHASFLAGEIGHWIVAISTLIFVIGCISGLVLWWPKKWNKTTRQASFTIKWKAKFKRFNYDLHNVYGFYTLLICLILGITGLIIFIDPMVEAMKKANGEEIAEFKHVLPQMDESRESKNAVEFAYHILEHEHPEKKMVGIWNFNQQKLGAFVFTSGKIGLKSVENADLIVYDRYTGEEIAIDKKILRAEKTENYVWQLHMGQWWGQFGKLMTFLSGVVATSLPITGFLIWWGKRKKPKRAMR
ncbi:PepSY-associated TM helix domain-containing protein [Myroides injenensis]|uniref:PepSY-associated TM helix domain-containing protein n=2 Tax=Myroides injenensis TaxID=1183151 RepID=UPI00226F5234|nr:PepSY-associated TM helix domain-containing protein [Myroides injenensis]